MALGQVGVAHRHRQGCVPEDLLERRQVARRHHEVAGEGMPEVVEPERLDFGLPQRPLKGRADTPPLAAVCLAEHGALDLGPCQPGQHLVNGLVHGDLAPAPALGLLEAEHPAGEVHPLPREAQNLAFPHPRIDGHGNGGQQDRALAGLRLTRGQEAHELILGEEAQAALRLWRQANPRHLLDVAPLLGQPEQVPEHGQLAVDRRRRDRAAELRDLAYAGAVVLGDPLRRDLGQRRVGAEPCLELREDLLVLVDRALPLPPLEGEVFLRDLREGLGRGGCRRRVPLEQPLGELILRGLARPLRAEAPLLLAVDLERVAPGDLADLVTGGAATEPGAFLDGGHQGLLSVVDLRA
ncbi:MAG: hypothetical protein Q7W02_02380 [Candidatus Rokubacteria bacterium]|nr:hypothetical protein [Candidatus Rokubacteria bacterium]